MKLSPLEIAAVVRQEIRRVCAAAAERVNEIHEDVLRKRAEWKIEYAMRTLEATDCLPTALNVFRQHWDQQRDIRSA